MLTTEHRAPKLCSERNCYTRSSSWFRSQDIIGLKIELEHRLHALFVESIRGLESIMQANSLSSKLYTYKHNLAVALSLSIDMTCDTAVAVPSHITQHVTSISPCILECLSWEPYQEYACQSATTITPSRRSLCMLPITFFICSSTMP